MNVFLVSVAIPEHLKSSAVKSPKRWCLLKTTCDIIFGVVRQAVASSSFTIANQTA